MISALYRGVVVHVRNRAPSHRLRYGIAQALFDLEELPGLDRRLRLFSYNRAGVVSFRDADHGDGSGDLLGWVRAELAAASIEARGRVQVLCLPRMFGYAFNPLSVFFCHDQAGVLRAILYQVNNTFGQRHSYLLPVEDGSDGPDGQVRQACAKRFHVSPFLPMGLSYGFAVRPPAETVEVRIAVSNAEEKVLYASFTGKRRPLTDAALLKALIAYPLMTAGVIVGIHWEALRLWLKGARYHAVPQAPEDSVTYGGARATSARDSERVWAAGAAVTAPAQGKASPTGRRLALPPN